MNIEEAIALYHDHIAVERRMAPGTVRNYITDLDGLRQYLAAMGVSDTDDLTSRDLRSWQMSHAEQGEAAGTIKRRLSSVRGWLRFLRRKGIVESDLMARVSSPKLPKRLPVFFKQSELEHLYDEGLFGTDLYGRRDRLLLRMLYETGMRRAELAGLTEASVDLRGLTVKVLGKRNKERYIPIEPELAAAIGEWIAMKHEAVGPTETLFINRHGKPLSPNMVYQVVHRYMSVLSTADRTSPHVFRHSFATHMLNEGAGLKAIQELLGHADLSSTEVYTHVTRQHLVDVYRHAFPRSGGNKQKNQQHNV